MRYNLVPLAFGLGASALTQNLQECTLVLDNSNVGNSRLAGEFQETNYLLNPDTGTLTDSLGRICAWDDEHKINCYHGNRPSHGWKYEKGYLHHKDCKDFVACPCEHKKEWNIYKHPYKHDLQCEPVHLKAHCGPTKGSPYTTQPQVGITPEVKNCLKWCKNGDWQCMQKCHALSEPPPAAPAHPEEMWKHHHPHYHHGPAYEKCCNKCKPDHKPCLKKCEKKCNTCPKPQPKPCNKCKPWNFACKKDCKPVPKQKCNECEKWRVAEGEKVARSVENIETTEAAVACDECPKKDYGCHKKCFGPKPPPCNKCNKVPSCEKKCWHVPPPPPPAMPEHHHPHHEVPPPKPKGPMPCNLCKPHDGYCFWTCVPPSAKEQRIDYWKPKYEHWHPEPEHHHAPHHVIPCHKCHPRKPECHKSCKPSLCSQCRPEHKECKSTCKKPVHFQPPMPWIKPWPQGPNPKPFPRPCDVCKPAEDKCHKSCVSRATLDRFVKNWEDAVTPEVAETLSAEELDEQVDNHLTAAVFEESVASNPDATEEEKQARIAEFHERVFADSAEDTIEDEGTWEYNSVEEAMAMEKRDEPATRVETSEAIDLADQANQCRCPDGDHECFKKCVHGAVDKAIIACSDCKKKGCPTAKKCQHVIPKPCNVCPHKDNRCKKSCSEPIQPKPVCNKCNKKEKECGCKKPISVKPVCEKCHKKPNECGCKKPLPPAPKCDKCQKKGPECACKKPFPPKPTCDKCNKCNKAPKECGCKKPIVPPPKIACWDCPKGDIECYKNCWHPAHPHGKPPPPPPPPVIKPCAECGDDKKCLEKCFVPGPPAEHKPCCDKCKEKSCFEKCDKKCKPFPPPPAPPKPEPKPCNKCEYKDFGCLESCFLEPWEIPNEKTKCCLKACKPEDWSCQRNCWGDQYQSTGIKPPVKPEDELPDPPLVHPQGPPPPQEKPQGPPPPQDKPQGPPPQAPPQGKPQGPPAQAPPAAPPAAPNQPAWGPPAGGKPGAPSGAPNGPTVKPTVVASTVAPPKSSAPSPAKSPVYNAPGPNAPKASNQPFGACPANVNGAHVFPSAIQQMPKNVHEKVLAPGAKIDASTSSVFTFDIPASMAGKTCSLFFHYPTGTTAAKTNGKGSAAFDLVSKPANGSREPVQKWKHINDVVIKEGNTFWVKDHACVPGEISFEMTSQGGFELSYQEKAGVGLFVRAC